MGKQLIPASIANKCKIPPVVRNASCKSGWLHIAVQTLFAVIIVSSFILLIFMLTMPQIKGPPPGERDRCRAHTSSCIVICNKVPYFGHYGDDIIYEVTKLPSYCPGVYLILNEPMFQSETLPSGWLPRLRLPVLELHINGGNLKRFTQNAFLNTNFGDIKVLILSRLLIESWVTNSFVGLTDLKQLWIRNCSIVDVATHVFRSVHSTLENLSITNSGKFDPTNITGTINLPHIDTVNFEMNTFNDILSRKSFTGLQHCKTLYLNSCNISAIGEGTFDDLTSLDTLFLNDNQLVTISATLFKNVLALVPKPRINLHDNNWHCDCSTTYIKALVINEVLLTHPVCRQPDFYAGKTFHEIVSHCNYTANRTNQIISTNIPPRQESANNVSNFVYINSCHNGDSITKNKPFKIVSPISRYECQSENLHHDDLHTYFISKYKNPISNTSDWISFSFFLKTNNYTVIEIGAAGAKHEYGILWYQSTCPNEVYCVNMVPDALQIYNIDVLADYVFCPINITANYSTIENEKCVSYNTKTVVHTYVQNKVQLLFVFLIGGTCLIMGAVCIYALVRQHPKLLKGSKKIVFVKHKSIDALVLPPKVPMRNDLDKEEKVQKAKDLKKEPIFVLPIKSPDISEFQRNLSTRSTKSDLPIYVAPLQPTENQLLEWHKNYNLKKDIAKPEPPPYSWMCNADTHIYMEIIENDKTYETMK